MPIQINETVVIDDSRNLQNLANTDASFVPYSNTTSELTATDVQAAIDEVAGSIVEAFPSGAIVIWSGSQASIPSGWVLCNGANGTPDLRNRFVVGAGDTYNVDATGGSADAAVIAHTHTFSGNTGSAGAHSHNVSGNTSDVGNHSHNYDRNTNASISYQPGNQGGGAGSGNNSASTSSAGAHGHSFSGTSNNTGAHTHSFSGTTTSTGSDGTNLNLPPYYALCYIMKT